MEQVSGAALEGERVWADASDLCSEWVEQNPLSSCHEAEKSNLTHGRCGVGDQGVRE